MIMTKEENSGASMQQPTVHAPGGERLRAGGVVAGKGGLLQQRLELIEDIYPLTQLGEGAQKNMQWLSKAPMSLLKFLV